MKKNNIFFLTVLFVLFVPAIINSLTVELISLERMTKESHAIVQGKISGQYSVWENNNIFTYTTLKINNKIKGSGLGEYVTIKQLGGTVGEDGQFVDGTPKLNFNDEVLLFLTFWKGNYWIHSIVLGKFAIVKENGESFAYNNLNNVGLIDPVSKEKIEDASLKSNKFQLSSFINEIKKFAN